MDMDNTIICLIRGAAASLIVAGATGTAVMIDSFDLADSFKIKLSSSKSLEIVKPVSQVKSRQI